MAVRVTEVPSVKFAEHAVPPEPQFIPAGLDVTLPFVGGEMDNVRVGAAATAKLAEHVLLAVMMMGHVLLVPQ